MTLLKIIKNFVFNYLRKLNLEAKMSISFFLIFPLIFCFHHFNEDYHVMLGQNWISIKCVMICLTKYWLKYGIINIDFITSRPCQEQQSMKTSHDLPVINRINRFFKNIQIFLLGNSPMKNAEQHLQTKNQQLT